MKHGSLFSGIGGFDLAAEWMGWDNVFHCEWNDFGQKVLKYYWPEAINYADITKTDFSIHRGSIDILSGGFPCQPYSQAGKRLGKEDDRHLWPEMLRAIGEIQPRWVVGENVRGLTNWNGGLVFDEVQADLEAKGYEVLPFLLPACAVNAPHRRDRIWFIAHSERIGDVHNGRGGGNLHDFNGYDTTEKSRREQFSNGFGSIGDEHVTDTSNARVEGLRRKRENQVPEFGITPNACINGSYGSKDRQGYIKGDDCYTAGEISIQQSQRCGDQATREIVANTSGKGFSGTTWGEQREVYSQTRTFPRSEFSGTFTKGNGWKDFPTQPPVCNGDDGLSSELDGITFSKWRNESIKAGGNAVVPQVAYQIFKAIQQYDDGL